MINTNNADLQFMERLESRLQKEIRDLEQKRIKYMEEMSAPLYNRIKLVVDQTLCVVRLHFGSIVYYNK
jgi:hypothetical protein